MYRATTILRWSSRVVSIQSPTKSSPEKCSCDGVPWRWFRCAGYTTKPGFATPNQIKALDQYCPVTSAAKICALHLSAHANRYWLVTSKYHRIPSLGFSNVPSLHHMYSSDTRTDSEGPESAISKVSSTGASEVSTTGDGGNTWIDVLENAHQSSINGSTDAGRNVKELSDAITLHVQELFGNHQDIEKVIVPLGRTLIGTAMAWFVMPIVLRKLHKYASEGPLMTLWKDPAKKDMSYQTSLWSALEDPAKYIITFMAFLQM
ncbi:hypothetical protein ACP70R_027589 [Stipagrostis hirtigluma subsp. patula]